MVRECWVYVLYCDKWTQVGHHGLWTSSSMRDERVCGQQRCVLSVCSRIFHCSHVDYPRKYAGRYSSELLRVCGIVCCVFYGGGGVFCVVMWWGFGCWTECSGTAMLYGQRENHLQWVWDGRVEKLRFFPCVCRVVLGRFRLLGGFPAVQPSKTITRSVEVFFAGRTIAAPKVLCVCVCVYVHLF